jgi:hypothetical protein
MPTSPAFSGTNGDVVRVSVSYKDSELIGQFYLEKSLC